MYKEEIKLVPLTPSVEVGAGPGHRFPVEIPGYRRGSASGVKIANSNMSTRTIDCNP